MRFLQKLSFLLALTFFSNLNAQILSDSFFDSKPEPVNCENWNKQEWDKYINESLLVDGARPNAILSKLKSVTDTCKVSFEKNNIGLCTKRIEGYYKQVISQGGGMYSAIMSDKDYLASIPKEASELPLELQNLPKGLPKDWRDLAKKNGWKYALFHSGTGNSARLVIHVPGKDYDKLLVYYAFDSRNSDPSNYDGVQMQAIQKTKDSTLPPKYYFNSFGFNGHGATPQAKLFGGRCVTCHSSGPRAIVPQKNPDFKTELGGVSSLEEFNNLIVQKKPPDLSPYYDLKNFPTHLKVGSYCYQCHNGTDRSSLALSVSRSGELYTGEFHRKVVTEETMPRELYETVDKNDRKKMVRGLETEFITELRKWMTETKCQGSSTAPVPATASPGSGVK